MSKALLQSLAFHLLLIAIIFLSSTSLFSRKEREVEVTSITVDLLPIAEKTNIKPKPRQIPKKAKPLEKPKPKPAPAKPQEKPKPPEKPKPEPKKEPPKEKPKEKEKPKDQPKKQDNELDALLKSLETEEPVEAEPSQENLPYDPTSAETISLVAAIQNMISKQIRQCWSVPAGARNVSDLQIWIDVDISRDGHLTFVGFAEPQKYNSDSFYQVAADSARRAILDPRCNKMNPPPPADKYHIWKELTVSFDPSLQIY